MLFSTLNVKIHSNNNMKDIARFALWMLLSCQKVEISIPQGKEGMRIFDCTAVLRLRINGQILIEPQSNIEVFIIQFYLSNDRFSIFLTDECR